MVTDFGQNMGPHNKSVQYSSQNSKTSAAVPLWNKIYWEEKKAVWNISFLYKVTLLAYSLTDYK